MRVWIVLLCAMLACNSIKEGPRLVPAETYLRTYLKLFGGLSPLQTQTQLVGATPGDVFDSWSAYVASIGMPDYVVDTTRPSQTNPLMLATYERLGNALCERSMEHDWRIVMPLAKRLIFAFDRPSATTPDSFRSGLDVLHRTFLGYPLKLAPAAREAGLWNVFQATKRAQAGDAGAGDAGARFTPEEAAWTSMCYALVRHPEFQFY
jgi:hypothetical protein